MMPHNIVIGVVNSRPDSVEASSWVWVVRNLLPWDWRRFLLRFVHLLLMIVWEVLGTTRIKIRRFSCEFERFEMRSWTWVLNIGWWLVDTRARCGGAKSWNLQETLRSVQIWILLTLVEKELDIMSFTVAIILTFSEAYVPGPMNRLIWVKRCNFASLTWVFVCVLPLTVFHGVEWSNVFAIIFWYNDRVVNSRTDCCGCAWLLEISVSLSTL